ncbi:MAG: hypothetical protein RR314_03920, partial [Oscillospiraceae bacterium]
MKKVSSRTLLWLFIAMLCLSVISLPILAADSSSAAPDAISGSRGEAYRLLSQGKTRDIYVSAGNGGSVSPDFSACAPGTAVTFAVEPDGGYKIASVAVISSDGVDLQLSLADGVYSFVMP